ncbi:MAG: CheY-like chemotaxis protein, partial [Colwellia sp.]
KANDFYLVILDVNMPNIAGITFLINLMRYVLCLSL